VENQHRNNLAARFNNGSRKLETVTCRTDQAYTVMETFWLCDASWTNHNLHKIIGGKKDGATRLYQPVAAKDSEQASRSAIRYLDRAPKG